MNKKTTRILCLVLAAILCLGLLAGIAPAISAAPLVDYQYGSGSYSNYVYNWGVRGTQATFLSPMAEEFYADNNVTYGELSALSGSSTISGIPSSTLYRELRELMVDNHDYVTSYDGTKNLFQFTDCQNGGGSISSFYSGTAIGPAWGQGGSWNREHTWPNSKGDDNGSGENDIIMLRPTAQSENSSRGNTAYGKSSGYYNPNKPSNNTYDLRGDVARIMLYVYTRWRDTSSTDPFFGTDGVIESKDVLLEWIAADPVDTWEMGRNDAVESITGTRNVYVDYPELAYALFNEGVPSMATPSGEAQGAGYTISTQIDDPSQGSATVSGRVITVTPAEGYALTGYTVTSGTAEITRDGNRLVVNASSDCTVKLTFAAKTPATLTLTANGTTSDTIDTYVGDTVILPGYLATLPEDYTFAGWVANDVAAGSAKPATIYTTGTSYTVTGNAELKALYSIYDENAGGSGSGIYTKITTMDELTTGDYVMVLDNGYAPLELDGTWITVVQPTVAGNSISDTQGAVWTITVSGTTAKLTDSNGVTIKPVSGNNNGIASGDYSWNVTCSSGKFQFGGVGSDTTTLAANSGSAYKLRSYKNTTVSGNPSGYPSQFTLYKPSAGGYLYTTTVQGFTPEDLTYTTIPQAVAIGEAMADGTFTTEKYYVTGVITEVENTTFGNLYIADADANVLKIYGTWDATGTNKYEALEIKPKVGDTVVLYGIIGNYDGEAEMKNAWIMDHVPGDGSNIPDVPTTTVTLVTDPVADTAYKFGLTQANKDNAVYYINGNMSGYYLGTTESAKAGVDVYLEETTGGYYLYASVGGVKKYLNMVVSGTHVNGVYENTAATVYTYNTEFNTLVAPISGVDYAFGTYDEYTTAGPIKADDGFFCNFYTLEGSGGEMPPVNPDPTPDPNPNGGVSYVENPVVGTAYKFVMYQAGQNKHLGFTGAMSGYYYGTSEAAADMVDVYLEEATGGYHIYFMNGTAKTYLNVIPRDNDPTKTNVVMQTLAENATPSIYELNTEFGYVKTTAVGDEWYLGTYGTNVTISASKTSYISDTSTIGNSQYVAWFATVDTAGGTTPDPEPPVDPPVDPDYVTQPVVGTGYKLAMNHIVLGKTLYMTDTPESATTTYRFQGTEDKESGITVYLEEVPGVTGGYRMYYMDGSTKTYIRVYEILDGSKKKGRTELTTTMPDEYFTYDSTFCTLVYTTEAGDSYYMGSYNDYETFSISSTYYLTDSTVDVTQYPARFYAIEGGNEPIEPEKNGWIKEGDKWYCYEAGVKVMNDWRKDSTGRWCYLTADGSMATNTFVQDSTGWAYVDESGYWKQDTAWLELGDDWYYLEGGYRVTGTKTISGKEYKFDDDGKLFKHTVIFKDADGTELSKAVYFYGDTVIVPDDPTKAADNIYTYTFAGWDEEVVTVAGDATYTATYIPAYREYTILFKNEDGTVLKTLTLHWGDAVIAPADPTKAEDENYTYTFTGWDKKIVAVAGDATYTAVYQAVEKIPEVTYYTITFKDADGTILSQTQYAEGETVTAPAAPTKAEDNTYTYTFAGWDKTVVAVAGNATYTATYTSTYKNYTVIFKNEDGTVLKTLTLHWGDAVTAPADPTKAADDNYIYTFSGWTPAIELVAGDATYTAVYQAVEKDPDVTYYTVIFKDEDGTVISTTQYAEGSEVTVPADPTKAEDNTYTYAFAGWDKEIVAVAGNATYTATYTPTYKNYTITFMGMYGVIETQTLHWGDEIDPPIPVNEEDDDYYYYFSAWDKELVAVAGNATYTAVYEKEAKIDTSINGWQQENGIWYFYENGVKVCSDWRQDSKGWCYLTDTGAMATDTFVEDSKGWAYVDESGYWKQGTYWQLVDGTWYYLENGYQVRNAWKKDSKGWCWLTETGAMATNTFVKDSKGWAYVDGSGYWKTSTGWIQLDGKWYYLEGGYSVRNAWRKDSKGWCWLTDTGAMATNAWVKDSKGWCYIGEDGYCWTNCWAKDSVGWVWLDSEGSMVYNQWIDDGYGWSYVGADGYMVINEWVKDSTGWCFMGEDGYMVCNDIVVDFDNEKIYYVDEAGYMVSSKWIGGGNTWAYFGADGAAVINDWVFSDGQWYFMGEDGLMIYNTTLEYQGKTYLFDANGVCTNP